IPTGNGGNASGGAGSLAVARVPRLLVDNRWPIRSFFRPVGCIAGEICDRPALPHHWPSFRDASPVFSAAFARDKRIGLHRRNRRNISHCLLASSWLAPPT